MFSWREIIPIRRRKKKLVITRLHRPLRASALCYCLQSAAIGRTWKSYFLQKRAFQLNSSRLQLCRQTVERGNIQPAVRKKTSDYNLSEF